jgi:hypothetical protein
MAYLDITPIGDAFRTLNGDFVLNDREVDIAADIIFMPQAGLKYAPLVYGEAFTFLNSNAPRAVIERKFRLALKTAGFSKPRVDVSDFPNVIGINNDQIITG